MRFWLDSKTHPAWQVENRLSGAYTIVIISLYRI
jgi:hypothetical protein